MFAYTTQLRVDLSVIGHIDGDESKNAYDIGYHLIRYFNAIERFKNSQIVYSISSFMFQMEPQQHQLDQGFNFSVKIILLDSLYLRQNFTFGLVNKFTKLFLSHFEDGRIGFEGNRLNKIFKLKRAGQCVDVKCDTTTGEVVHLEAKTTPTTTTTTTPKSTSIKDFPNKTVFLMIMFCIVYNLI